MSSGGGGGGDGGVSGDGGGVSDGGDVGCGGGGGGDGGDSDQDLTELATELHRVVEGGDITSPPVLAPAPARTDSPIPILIDLMEVTTIVSTHQLTQTSLFIG